MSSLSSRYNIRLATEKDKALINQVFDSEEFSGKIAVQFSRHPNPYKSLEQEAHRTVLALVFDTKENKVCGTGCCQVRESYLDGKPATVGYLSSMRIIPEYRGKLINIAGVYDFIFENTPEVDFYYTTILKENHQAIKMLEKPRTHFPNYYKLGEYTVFCLSPNIRIKKEPEYMVEACGEIEKKDFMKNHAHKQSLGIKNLLEAESVWYCLKNKMGDLLGVCALANQLEYKQYIIRSYEGVLKLLPFLPTALLGYPRVPKPNKPANYASLHSLLVMQGKENLVPFFLSEIIKKNQKYDFFMVGAMEQSLYFEELSRLRHIKYQSYLYEVKSRIEIDLAKIQLDVGLL